MHTLNETIEISGEWWTAENPDLVARPDKRNFLAELGANPQTLRNEDATLLVELARLGLSDGQQAKLNQGGESVTLVLRICEEVPSGAIWLKAGSSEVSALGDSFGPISVEAV